MKDKAYVQSFWIGDRLSPIENLCIRSFLDNDFEFHLYTFGDLAGIPEGTTVKDANDIVSRTEFFHSKGKYALFADYFRFRLLLKKGGIWVDMDMVCLKPFEYPDDVILAKEDYSNFAIGFMKFPVDHVLVHRMLERATFPPSEHLNIPFLKNIPVAGRIGLFKKLCRYWVYITSRNESELVKRFSLLYEWGTLLGPRGLTEEYINSGVNALELGAKDVYPVSYMQWKNVFTKGGTSLIDLRNSIMLHLWHEMIQRDGNFDKFARPQEGSIYAALCEKHGILFE